MLVLLTHLIKMLSVDLPEAAGSWLAEWTGPAQAWSRAGVRPGPVSWNLELWSRRGTTRGPVEMSGRGLSQSVLDRSGSWSWSGTGLDSLTADLGVVEVLLPLGLIWSTAGCLVRTQRKKEKEWLVCLEWKLHSCVAQIQELLHDLKILSPPVFLMLFCIRVTILRG